MSCQEFVDFLSQYLDGELPEAERARFDEHLDECAECTAYISTFQTTIELARLCSRPEPEAQGLPGDVPESLIAGILQARQARGS